MEHGSRNGVGGIEHGTESDGMEHGTRRTLRRGESHSVAILRLQGRRLHSRKSLC